MDRKTRIAKNRDKVKQILLLATIMFLAMILFITLLQTTAARDGSVLRDSNSPQLAGADNKTHGSLLKTGYSDTSRNGRRNFKPVAAPKNKRGNPSDDIHFKLIRAANKANTHRSRVKDTHNFVPTGRSLPSLGGRVESMRTKTLTPRFDKGGGSQRRPLPLKNYDWLDTTIGKIHKVESGGKLTCPDGDNGRAAGPMQLHKSAVDDVNRHYGTRFTDNDRYDSGKAKQIAKLYIAMWMETHKEEIACRIFNGGPRGWQKTSTDEYWQKITKGFQK